jgi:hypothetical protein
VADLPENPASRHPPKNWLQILPHPSGLLTEPGEVKAGRRRDFSHTN